MPKSVTQAVLDAIPEKDEIAERPDRFRTTDGSLFELKPVPPLFVREAQRMLEQPKAPRTPNYSKDESGRVLEENLNDPDYITAMEEYFTKRADTGNAIMLIRGTRLLEKGEGVEDIDSNDWVEFAQEYGGITVPDNKMKRYFAWMKFVALPTMPDFLGIIHKVSVLSGMITEASAAQAAEEFRPDAEGDTAVGVRPPAEAPSGPVGDAGDTGVRS